MAGDAPRPDVQTEERWIGSVVYRTPAFFAGNLWCVTAAVGSASTSARVTLPTSCGDKSFPVSSLVVGSGMPADPGRVLDDLAAAGAAITKVGTVEVRGVATDALEGRLRSLGVSVGGADRCQARSVHRRPAPAPAGGRDVPADRDQAAARGRHHRSVRFRCACARHRAARRATSRISPSSPPRCSAGQASSTARGARSRAAPAVPTFSLWFARTTTGWRCFDLVPESRRVRVAGYGFGSERARRCTTAIRRDVCIPARRRGWRLRDSSPEPPAIANRSLSRSRRGTRTRASSTRTDRRPRYRSIRRRVSSTGPDLSSPPVTKVQADSLRGTAGCATSTDCLFARSGLGRHAEWRRDHVAGNLRRSLLSPGHQAY